MWDAHGCKQQDVYTQAGPAFDRTRALLFPNQCAPSGFSRHAPKVYEMERDANGELKGQTSINELLDEPLGAVPHQLPLPIMVQVKPGHYRRVS